MGQASRRFHELIDGPSSTIHSEASPLKTVAFCSALFGRVRRCYPRLLPASGRVSWFSATKWPIHAQNRGGEAGIRTLGPFGSAVFKSGLGRSRGFADDPIHEGIGRFQGLEFAGVRLCCYRLLLPVAGPLEGVRSVLSSRDRGHEMAPPEVSESRPSDPKGSFPSRRRRESIRASTKDP